MGESRTIRVLAVDDHELLRRGIRFSLLAVEDVELVGEAQDSDEALQQCEASQPDVVLMDMRLAGSKLNGIETTQLIRSRYPHIQVIVLSSFHDKDMVQGAMQAGAIGYLVKGVSAKEMSEAIRAAYAGKPTLAAEALADLVQPASKEYQVGHDLTEREQEVLPLLVEGLSNPQIAQRMHLSTAAVKYHVSNILSKLEASNRTEAATIAIEHNLVPKR